MKGMFEGCTSLTSLNLSNFDTSKVIYMGGMFANCSSLVSFDISNFNTQAVQHMEGMFYGTSNLTNYSLPNFDVKSVTTAEAMFAGSKINTVKMNKSSFNSKANLKYFVNNNGQIMNLTVRTKQDKALFTKLNLSKLTVNVSTN